ncbi:hypothetical protein GCM10022420_061880 [Streptomyces iranensis]
MPTPAGTSDTSRPASAANPAPERADNTHGTTAPVTTGSADGTTTEAAGASSRITWALVPLMPNDDTPARLGRSAGSQGRASASSRTSPADHSTCGDGSSACSIAGSVPCRIASTILITPATPAAPWVWPMFDFTDPSHNGRSSGRSCPYVASNACASIGSPSVVPVPCPSTASTSPGVNRASARARRMTRSCDGPLGADRPLDAPSWFTALPRNTPSTGCPSRRASDRRSSSTTPTPSPQPVPSAAAENGLHRPSDAKPPCAANSANTPSVASTVTPPASASEHSPFRSA